MERTLVLVKPDGVRRGLIGEVVGRIEAKGWAVVAMRMLTIDRELAERHYEEHAGKPFFGELVDFITSGPVVAMVVEGPSVISSMRLLMGATNPIDAMPGTIRGDLASVMAENVIHGSDSPESARREVSIFFPEI